MTKHEIIRASALKQREYLEAADKTILKNLEKNVEHLAEKVDESTRANIELQEKIVELMSHLTDLVENIQKMSSMMNNSDSEFGQFKYPEYDESSKEKEFPVKQGLHWEQQNGENGGSEEDEEPEKTDVSSQLKALAKQNMELTNALRSLEKQLKKGAVRDAIKKALEKVKK